MCEIKIRKSVEEIVMQSRSNVYLEDILYQKFLVKGQKIAQFVATEK